MNLKQNTEIAHKEILARERADILASGGNPEGIIILILFDHNNQLCLEKEQSRKCTKLKH